MGVDMDKMEKAFVDGVCASAQILADLGLNLRKDCNRLFYAESELAQVMVVLEWNTIATMLKPLSRNARMNYTRIQADIGWVHSPADVAGEVSRQLEYLAEEYRHVFMGDIGTWRTE